MNIAALLAGLFSGIIASMGMGGGAVLLIYLTVFAGAEQLAAQGINLLFFIPIGMLAIIIYAVKKKIKFKKVLPLALFGLIGALPGICISKIIKGDILSDCFAIFLIFLGTKELFAKDKTKS